MSNMAPQKTIRLNFPVTPATHKALTTLAEKHERTIGTIAGYGVQLAIKDLAANPKNIAKVEPDRRRA